MRIINWAQVIGGEIDYIYTIELGRFGAEHYYNII